jgi:hypothetical protein
MRNLLFLSFISIILFASSCKDNPQVELSSDIKLNFIANFDGDLLLLEKEYSYAGDMPIKFSQFNFYIANVALIKQNGNEFEETELLEIDFVDFPYNLNQETEAEKGQTIQINKIPVGDYDGIKIGFGVPADLNRTKTNDYGPENPLSMASHYWDGWSSYIFSKIEGKADMDYDGTFETNDGEGLTYHMGTDDVYTTRTLFENISLKENQTLELQLNIDLQKLFLNSDPDYDENGDGYLDIEKYESVHAEDRLVIAKQLMNNYSVAVSLVE